MGRIKRAWNELRGKRNKPKTPVRYKGREIDGVIEVDSNYFPVDSADMYHALRFAGEVMRNLGYEYTPEIEDCDEFALMKMLLCRHWFKLEGVTKDNCPDIGYISYKTDDGGYHAIVRYVTDDGKTSYNECTDISKGTGHWRKHLSKQEEESIRRSIK